MKPQDVLLTARYGSIRLLLMGAYRQLLGESLANSPTALDITDIVVEGMDSVHKIKRGEPVMNPDKIVRATVS